MHFVGRGRARGLDAVSVTVRRPATFISVQEGPTGFYIGNRSILYAVQEVL